MKDEVVGAVISFSGIVQGVGFRPSIYRIAHSYNLKGAVQNTPSGVVLKVDGHPFVIEEFYQSLLKNLPPLAEIHQSKVSYCKPFGFSTFSIKTSRESEEGFTPLSPDIAICNDCLEELFNPADRRYRYPFINCTNCGPRFTIINSIPYDRKNTTMINFKMCQECQKEYENPMDRRYHAQPNGCPVCGPRLMLFGKDYRQIRGDPIKNSVEMLLEGRIVAIKGLGGYHLAVFPLKKGAVERLRERKKRPGKPFALMVRDINTAEKYCRVDEKAKKLLLTYQRPIVILEKKTDFMELSPSVAPDTECLGIMLPYTPLHYLILSEGPDILVMTSANFSEEPLVYRDEDAFDCLGEIADAFLTHNRDIARPCDDSVVNIIDGEVVPIRRSRGYVPGVIHVKKSGYQVLSVGALEKNTFCVFKEGRAFLSHHIGDLNNEKSVDAFIRGIEDFTSMFRLKYDAIACDQHPDYFSTYYAEDLKGHLNIPLIRVQHHHAHIASLLGESQFTEKVIGVAFDGTGFGEDGTIWGGEFLVADQFCYRRVGYYKPVPMPGGEKAIKEIDRIAISYLIDAFGSVKEVPDFDFMRSCSKKRSFLLESMIKQKVNTPFTSSCGRLFDAVSSMLGLCMVPSYEAQGAILLEKQAGTPEKLPEPYEYSISGEENVVCFESMIERIVDDLIKGVDKRVIAQKFHATVVSSAVEVCKRVRKIMNINTVALSGGVFQNRIIFRYLKSYLESEGFSVLVHSRVPPNDGGISLGQGVVALKRLERGEV